MSIKAQQRMVQRAERRLEACSLQTATHWDGLKQTWRDGWTPFRIISAGLAAGFLVGRSSPLSAITGTHWVQIAGTMSEWFAIVRANLVAGLDETGDEDTQAAEAAASSTTPPQASTEPPPRAPTPAEAATELSER